MTQPENTQTPSLDDVAAYVLQTHAGDIDGPRIVQVVIGTWVDVQARMAIMNDTLRLVHGSRRGSFDDIEVTADGPHPVHHLRPTDGVSDDPGCDHAELSTARAGELVDSMTRALDSITGSTGERDLREVRTVLRRAIGVLSNAAQRLDLEDGATV